MSDLPSFMPNANFIESMVDNGKNLSKDEPNSTVKCSKNNHWIALNYCYKDHDETPAANAPYKVLVDGNEVASGNLDEQGNAREENIPPGKVEVIYGDNPDEAEAAKLRKEFVEALDGIIKDQEAKKLYMDEALDKEAWWKQGLIYTGAALSGAGDSIAGIWDMVTLAADVLSKAQMEYFDILNAIVTGDIDKLEQKLNTAREEGNEIVAEAVEIKELLIAILDDPETLSYLRDFPGRYWDALPAVDKTRMAGGAIFDIVVGIVLAAVSGGAGGVAMATNIASKLGSYGNKAISTLKKLAKALKKIKQRKKYNGVTKANNDHIVETNPKSGTSRQTGKVDNDKTCPEGSKVCKGGEPISLVTGEELLTQQDFVIDTPLPLEWNRTYRTGHCRNTGLGHGWTYPLTEYLSFSEREISLFNYEGRVISFPVIREQGQFTENTAEQITLNWEAEDVYRLTAPDQPDKLFKRSNQVARLYRLEDAANNYWQCHYEKGYLTSLKSNWGRAVVCQYSGRLLTQLEELRYNTEGQITHRHTLVTYQYDQSQDLIAVVDCAGNKEQFAYKNHVITRRILKTGFSFYFEWDQYNIHGLCVHQWGDNGIYDYRFGWDDDNKITTCTDSNGGVRTVYYNERGLVDKEIDPEGGETLYEYDEHGRKAKTIDPNGAATEYQYNDSGLLACVIDAEGNQHQLAYDDAGRVTAVTDPLGNSWLREYNRLGLLTKRIDPEGNETQIEYTKQGLPSKITNPLGQVRLLLWDAHGELVAEKDHEGSSQKYAYNPQGQIIASQDHNLAVTRYEYNTLGLISKISQPDGQIQQFEYNAAGQLTRYIDGAGRVTQYQYDGLSQVRKRIDPAGQSLEYFYDKERNLVGLKNEKAEIYRLIYDKNERLISEIGFDGREQHYQYDSAGHLIASIDGSVAKPESSLGINGSQPADQEKLQSSLLTQFTRNKLGQLISKATADGEATHFQYDACGHLITAQNPHRQLAFEYNSQGYLTLEKQDDTELKHGYDALGNRIESVLPSGQVLAFKYNHQQLYTQIALDGNPISQLKRDVTGREIARLQGNTLSEFEYDPVGRLQKHRVLTKGQQQPLIQRQYGYDQSGNLNLISDLKKGATRFYYDALDRLTQVQGFINEQFAFDPANNLLAKKDSSEPELPTTTSPQQSKGNRLAFFGDRRFEYDNRGNLIKEKRGREGRIETHYFYNTQNQLVKVKNQKGEFDYKYDALGRRVSKTTPQGEVQFYWNGDVLLSEVRPKQQKLYIYEPDSFKPLAQIINGKLFYYYLDHLGTPQEMTAENGELVWSGRYKAYGALALKEKAQVENNLRFQGQYHDEETGLHYNRFRYYHPEVGRFINQDPIGLLGGVNSFQYAANPVNWVDPLGLMAKPEDCPKLPKLKGTAESAQRQIEELLNSGTAGKEISVDVATREEAEKLMRSMFIGGDTKYTNTTGVNPANAKYSNDVIGQMQGKVASSKAGTYHWDDELDSNTGRVIGHGTSHGDYPHLQVHHKDGPIIRVNFNWDSDSAWSPHDFKPDDSGYQN
ncbi:RHS repeat-associated core domain-containing protein [Spartinivicinus ruber]|uniref:RHS repeat-associated core domain-containing protein n=1 Tax=Spartinivicinus ruber TaxID=2683272 RepID=UPI0013D20B51|nr:RHS repeat-associated core domain-containing protein [Spartinivicinus ruber]